MRRAARGGGGSGPGGGIGSATGRSGAWAQSAARSKAAGANTPTPPRFVAGAVSTEPPGSLGIREEKSEIKEHELDAHEDENRNEQQQQGLVAYEVGEPGPELGADHGPDGKADRRLVVQVAVDQQRDEGEAGVYSRDEMLGGGGHMDGKGQHIDEHRHLDKSAADAEQSGNRADNGG